MSYKMNKKVLITGVAGLLGSRLADWIIENKPEIEVIGIDDLSGGYKENINPKVKFVEIDLVKDSNLLESIFEKYTPDYVFHFAAYAAEGLSPFIRTYNYDNNLRSTAAVVNECIKHDVKRLIFTSTLAVYGHGYGGIFDEKQQKWNSVIPATNQESFINLIEHAQESTFLHPKTVFTESIPSISGNDEFIIFTYKNKLWTNEESTSSKDSFFSKNVFVSWNQTPYVPLYLVILLLLFVFIDIVFSVKGLKI